MSACSSRPHRNRTSVIAGTALIVTFALAACEGSSDEPQSKLASTLVDGKVCGLFDPDLVVSLIGHRDIAVRGSGIASAPKRTSDTIDCEVIDDRRVKTAVLAVVAEQPKTERVETEAMLGSELSTKTDCSQPAIVTDLGAGYVCTPPSGDVQVNVLLPQRLVRLTYEPGPDASGDPVANAVKLVADLDANINAYDDAHPGQ